jgi:hypothetical protein
VSISTVSLALAVFPYASSLLKLTVNSPSFNEETSKFSILNVPLLFIVTFSGSI